MLIRLRLPPLVRFRKFLSEYTAEYMHIKSFDFFYIYISAWSYVNRVSKHFVISLNFACRMACLLSCLLMSFFFVRFVVRALCRCGCRQNFANFFLPPAPSSSSSSLSSPLFTHGKNIRQKCDIPPSVFFCFFHDNYLKPVRA